MQFLAAAAFFHDSLNPSWNAADGEAFPIEKILPLTLEALLPIRFADILLNFLFFLLFGIITRLKLGLYIGFWHYSGPTVKARFTIYYYVYPRGKYRDMETYQ